MDLPQDSFCKTIKFYFISPLAIQTNPVITMMIRAISLQPVITTWTLVAQVTLIQFSEISSTEKKKIQTNYYDRSVHGK